MTPATAAASTGVQRAAAPRAPATLEHTGLALDHVEQLIIKTLYLGEASGLQLSERVSLPYHLIEPIIERSRAERLVEVKGASGTGTAGYRYNLTDLGRDRGRQYIDANGYIGAAPVPLAVYVAHIQSLAASRGFIDRERLRTGFTDLIVGQEILDQIGPAVNANKSIFLYGPPGNGKTVLAEGMGRALGGDMFIPRAIDIDGQIIALFDPVNHVLLDANDEQPSVVTTMSPDRRWVRIKRPVVMVGGELTLDMLDLTFNPLSRYYEAPIQLKANGGVFLVDDFGRQRIRPEDLLNRWIVPLESRWDYLTLHTGKKFQVPFDVLTVFATNLDPQQLADEAFLRRIPYKIAVGDPTIEQFTRIFEMNCQRRNLQFHQVMVAYLLRRHYRPNRRPLRSCQPRDLLEQVTAMCRYLGRPPAITRELIDAACDAYFVEDERRVAERERRKLEVQ